jgi:hypothetical protein
MSPRPNASAAPIRLFPRAASSGLFAETQEPKEAHKSLRHNNLAVSPWRGRTCGRALTPSGGGVYLGRPLRVIRYAEIDVVGRWSPIRLSTTLYTEFSTIQAFLRATE